MPITQILLTSGSSRQGTLFDWASDFDSWNTTSGPVGNSVYSDPAPATGPIVTSGGLQTTRNFTGSEYMFSPLLSLGDSWVKNSNAIAVNFWFYPTANSIQLLSEVSAQLIEPGFHYSVLEIDNSNYIKAKFWQTGSVVGHQTITSTNTVVLNRWNHIYFAENPSGAHTFELNGVATTGLPTYTRLSPGSSSEYFVVGYQDATNMGNNGRFQGKIGWLTISDYPIGSTYSGTSSQFPIYTLAPAGYDNVNEGSAQTFNVGGTYVPAATYYWTVETNAGDFATADGTVTVSSGTGGNLGSFTVTPTADATTEGAETFTVALRSGSTSGPILATSSSVTINDTSLDPVQLTSGTSLNFDGEGGGYVIVSGNQSDWNLGNNWTIEWWQKIPEGIDGFLSVLCQDANVPAYSGIDVFVNAGNICMFNGNLTVAEAPATRGLWNHIAIQKNGTTLAAYINGISRSVGGPHSGTIAPSSPLNVCIGSRTYDGGANFYGQYFNGQLANIRISDVARYTSTFTPPTTVVTDVNTKLSLDGSLAGGDGMLVDETARHTVTNFGATEDTIT
jgi:hypothetical protein